MIRTYYVDMHGTAQLQLHKRVIRTSHVLPRVFQCGIANNNV